MLTDKAEVETFLNTFFKFYCNYTISDDGVIDVDGDISLKIIPPTITELPIQFGVIKGDFSFEETNFITLKGFPYNVGGFCSIDNSKYLKSLQFSPQCKTLYCNQCISLESLDGLNCENYENMNGEFLNLKRIGNTQNCKSFAFKKLPAPTADEMRHFIQLNVEFITDQEAPWITIIKDYYEHKDVFRAIGEFEALYNEPWVKPEDRIEINNDLNDFSL